MPNGCDHMEPTPIEIQSQLMAQLICQIATCRDGRPGKVNGTTREATESAYGNVSWMPYMRNELLEMLKVEIKEYETRRKSLVKSALQKLTPEERVAIGIKENPVI